MKICFTKSQIFRLFLISMCLVFTGVQLPVMADETDALDDAIMYLNTMPFSRKGLISMLEFSGHTAEEAEYAADNCGADWNENAKLCAENYLQNSAYSKQGLIRQLESESEGYTHEQAVYGVEIAGADIDWNDEAYRRAEFYLRSFAFSETGLVRQMESEQVGFTHEQAFYGVKKAGEQIDWNEMAAKRAEEILKTSIISLNGLIRQLESETIGFTHEQAVYGAETAGADVDWNEMAVQQAEAYTNVMSVSRSELIQHLESESEGFTHDQAVFAADNIGAAWGDMVTVLSENIDNLFPIHSLEESFTPIEQALYSDIGSDTAIQTQTNNGARSIILFANPDSVHDHNYTVKVNSGNLSNFMLTMEISPLDIYPKGQAGCFIGYTNEYPASLDQEELSHVYLMIDGLGAGFYNKTADEDSGSFSRISDEVAEKYTLTIIRFLGQTYAFVNNVYTGQLTDTNAGPFALVYGVSTLKDGDTAGCLFDNLSVRKVN